MPRNNHATSSSRFHRNLVPAHREALSAGRCFPRRSRVASFSRLRSSSRPASSRTITGVRLKYVSYFTMLFALLCLLAFLAGNARLPG